jgi:hypothetical protein
MSNWNPNSRKHRAMHGGYNGKPTKESVSALLGLYSSCQVDKKELVVVNKKESNTQLKLDF